MLKKRSITLLGHSTSVALEPEFWAALEAMARAEGATLIALIGRIDEGRAGRPLASACRLAGLRWAQDRYLPGEACSDRGDRGQAFGDIEDTITG